MNVVGVKTLLAKEIKRSLSVPLQTFGTPVVTTLLYFLIFGAAIGSRVGPIGGIDYADFIMPGLIMMNVLTTAFQGVAFGVMFQRIVGKTINDILVAPMSYLEVASGFILASALRALAVGALVFVTGMLFVSVQVAHPVFLLVFTLLVAIAFASFGFIAGLWAKSFEQLSIIPTFIIMPLSFLGGLFYSIEMLPPLAQSLSRFNPVFYMVNGVRYAFYTISDVSVTVATTVVVVLTVTLLAVVWQLLRVGYNLRN